MGLVKDLHLRGNEFSNVSSVFSASNTAFALLQGNIYLSFDYTRLPLLTEEQVFFFTSNVLQASCSPRM